MNFNPSIWWIREQQKKLHAKELEELNPPHSNTGGKFVNRAGAQEQTAIIDYLSFTLPASLLDVPEPDLSGDPLVQWVENLSKHFRDFTGQDLRVVPQNRGLFGFSDSAKIVLKQKEVTIDLGLCAWGGRSQAGKLFVSFTGVGCSIITNWLLVAEWLQSHSATITRVDVAVDYLNGEYTVEDAVQAYTEGGFATRGRMPSHRLQGDWLTAESPKGRTLYVGERKNGKQVRIYEKGKQLGDKTSQWNRFEVELHNIDRVIPYDILTIPLEYWHGSCSWFSTLVESASRKIETVKKIAQQSVDCLVGHASNAYGKLINVLMDITDHDPEQVVNLIRRSGVPSSLKNPLAIVGYDGVSLSHG